MCAGACAWLLAWLRVAIEGTGPCASPHHELCPRCNSRALEEASMREYMRWIAATFPNDTVRDAPDVTFPDAVARFADRFPRDSPEYIETLRYFTLHAGQRYMRLGVAEFVDVLAVAVQAVERIAGHTDGEMHEYLQWIRRNRGHLPVGPGDTAAAVLDRFLARAPCDSPAYRAVFRSFLSSRAVNHTEARMDEFVREIRWVLPPGPHSTT